MNLKDKLDWGEFHFQFLSFLSWFKIIVDCVRVVEMNLGRIRVASTS